MEDRTGYSSHLSNPFRILRCGILFDGAEEVLLLFELQIVLRRRRMPAKSRQKASRWPVWPAAWPVWLLGH
jgi:hypothetical protein